MKQAMIFAAGLGTRLRPLTDNRPKALVEVNGMPMLDRVVENLKRAQFERIIINVHHFADMMIEHIRNRSDYGMDIAISDERQLLLDTAGGIRKALDFIDTESPLLIHNADILTDIDLKSMYDRFNSLPEADAMLLCSAERKSSRYFLFDREGRMHGWINEKTGQIKPEGLDTAGLRRMAFGGLHVIGPKVSDMIRRTVAPDHPCSITPFYIDNCQSLDLRAYIPSSAYRWFDIGSIEKLALAESAYKQES